MLFSHQLSYLPLQRVPDAACVFLSQDTMEKVSTPSLSLLPAIFQTVTWLTTTTSWRISSCKCLVRVCEGEEGEEGNSDRGEAVPMYSSHQEPQLDQSLNPGQTWPACSCRLERAALGTRCPQRLQPSPVSKSIQTLSGNYASDGLTLRLEHMEAMLNSWQMLLLEERHRDVHPCMR